MWILCYTEITKRENGPFLWIKLSVILLHFHFFYIHAPIPNPNTQPPTLSSPWHYLLSFLSMWPVSAQLSLVLFFSASLVIFAARWSPTILYSVCQLDNDPLECFFFQILWGYKTSGGSNICSRETQLSACGCHSSYLKVREAHQNQALARSLFSDTPTQTSLRGQLLSGM